MNVLLLDDEPIELAQLKLLINNHYPTWNVYQALNGSEAISLADSWEQRGETFQLAFIDIKLPGRDGLEVAAILKKKMPDLELIVLSALQNFHYAKESIKLKVFDYLVKPVIEKELLGVLSLYVQENPEYGLKSEVVERVVEKIKKGYQNPLRLSTIAQELYINPNYLSRLFSEELGMSFSEFLLQYRIEMAKQLLLKHRELSIQFIAGECGFSSQHHLSTAFKKYVKLSPSEYRSAGNHK